MRRFHRLAHICCLLALLACVNDAPDVTSAAAPGIELEVHDASIRAAVTLPKVSEAQLLVVSIATTEENATVAEPGEVEVRGTVFVRRVTASGALALDFVARVLERESSQQLRAWLVSRAEILTHEDATVRGGRALLHRGDIEATGVADDTWTELVPGRAAAPGFTTVQSPVLPPLMGEQYRTVWLREADVLASATTPLPR